MKSTAPILTPGETPETLLRNAPPESVLLPYQQRWIADPAQVKVIEKSRRIGLSWAAAADDALYAASRAGANCYYMAYNQEMTQQYIRDAAFWSRFYNLAASEVEEIVLRDQERDVKIYQITYASGHVIQALSSAPRNLRSKGAPGERVTLDEFAFHDDQEELLKAALAFLMWGGQVRILSTHNGAENPFNTLVQEVREGKKPYSLHRVTLDDALTDGLFRRISLVRGKPWSAEAETKWRAELVAFYGDGADEELFCEPRHSSGRYLPRVLVEQCMGDEGTVARLRLKPEFATLREEERTSRIDEWIQDNLTEALTELDLGLKSSFGLDFARSGDLTVLMVSQEGQDLVRRVPLVVEMSGVPFEQQRQVLFYVIRRMPRFIGGAMDKTGNGAYLAEVTAQAFGFSRIHQVQLSANWYLENFPRYKAGLEDRKVLLPKDADILDDHGDVQMAHGVPSVPAGKKRTGRSGEQRHGDAAISACLMWFASEHGAAPVEFEAAEERESARAWGDAATEVIDMETGFGVLRTTDVLGTTDNTFPN